MDIFFPSRLLKKESPDNTIRRKQLTLCGLFSLDVSLLCGKELEFNQLAALQDHADYEVCLVLFHDTFSSWYRVFVYIFF